MANTPPTIWTPPPAVLAALRRTAEAKVSKSGSRFIDGVYDLIVTAFLVEEKRDGVYAIVEFKVDSSSSVPESYWRGQDSAWQTDAGAAHVPATAAGRETSCLWKLFGGNNPGFGNTKSFVEVLLDEKAAGDDEFLSVLTMLADPNTRPAVGRRIHCSTARRSIKSGPNAGRPYVGQNWTHIPQTDDEIASLREKFIRAA